MYDKQTKKNFCFFPLSIILVVLEDEEQEKKMFL